jgi:hypothetical protein
MTSARRRPCRGERANFPSGMLFAPCPGGGRRFRPPPFVGTNREEKGETVMASKYGNKSKEEVHKAMHEMKEGKLKSGKSGKKVTNPKQAVAIGLSKARKKGGKVPAKKH